MWFLISFLNKKTQRAITQEVEEFSQKNLDYIDAMLPYLYNLYEEAVEILSEGDVSKRYKTTYIPKKSGGKRRIDEPDARLKEYMKKVVYILTNKFNLVFPKSAYAYIKGRNIKQMAEAHRGNKMILKLDIKNFFPNCTLNFILDAMLKVYPFCIMDIEILKTIVKACMIKYDGEYGLPQGAPTSPILSNIAMIPIDYYFILRGEGFYTRYADDIYMSFGNEANYPEKLKDLPKEIEKIIQSYNAKFKLNEDKTHLVRLSKSNGVWITGIMLNKDNNITIGYKSKKKLKAIVWSFLMDAKNNKHWSKEELYKMLGIVGYWKFIEPKYVKQIIHKYEIKTGMNYKKEIDNIYSK